MSGCPASALFRLRKKRKEMSARAGAKECCLGASFIGMAFPCLLTAPGTAGEVLEKDLGSTVEGGVAASSIKARSFQVLNPHVKAIVCFSLGESP
jgi:hypothetical protein